MTSSNGKSSGRLFGWGLGMNNCLPGAGYVDKDNHVCFPEHLIPEKTFTKICADVGTFAALTNQGELLVWGSGRNCISETLITCSIPIQGDRRSESAKHYQPFKDIAVNNGSVFGIHELTEEVFEFNHTCRNSSGRSVKKADPKNNSSFLEGKRLCLSNSEHTYGGNNYRYCL